MGPLEALHRFQIDCGDLETPLSSPKTPIFPLVPAPLIVEFPELPPPVLPMPALTQVAQEVPPLADVPTTVTPVESVPVPGPVPEPGTLLLTLSGAAVSLAVSRRQGIARQQA